MTKRHVSAVLSGIFLAFSLAGGIPVQAETEPITADLVVSCNTACTVEIKPETSEDIAPRTYKYLVSQKSNDSSVEKNDDSVYEVEVFVEYLDGSNKLGEIITVKKQGSSSKSGEIKFENTLKKKPESKKPESKPAAPTPTPVIGPDVQRTDRCPWQQHSAGGIHSRSGNNSGGVRKEAKEMKEEATPSSFFNISESPCLSLMTISDFADK